MAKIDSTNRRSSAFKNLQIRRYRVFNRIFDIGGLEDSIYEEVEKGLRQQPQWLADIGKMRVSNCRSLV